MKNSKNVSFRNETVGSINDLLVDEGLTCADSQNLLAFLADQLVAYQEEGRSLTPDIIYCSDMAQSLQGLPGLAYHEFGQVVLSLDAGKQILKDCAPLSGPRWFIIIERVSQSKLRYGIASYADLPTSIPLVDGILLNENTFTILMRKTGNKAVTIWGSRGNKINFLFSTLRQIEDDQSAISQFTYDLVSGIGLIDADQKIAVEEFRLFIERTFCDTISTSHGCILAAIDVDNCAIADELDDCIRLSEPISLLAVYSAYKSDPSAESLINVQSTLDLLRGFVNSDGIVIFSTMGNIVAFRAFYHPGPSSQVALTISGGARRRAFEGVKSLVPVSLKGLLFRSQDGLTLYHGGSNG